mmetsp:Transcript_70942/g.178904  ORF Transcript_70942/g.178904 Transcript_70942/m.178904 type:complete len:246 (-) Transcript_70942:76-813(-)
MADVGQLSAGLPTQHPLWQGSVSSKWMDSASNQPRGRCMVPCSVNQGVDGVAARGLSGYFTDVPGKLREDRLQVRAFPHEGPLAHSTPPLRGAELNWKTSRRVCAPPTVTEPTRLTAQPPFVPRKGSLVCSWSAQSLPPVYDAEGERYQRAHAEQRERVQKARARQEDRVARSMVLGLEDWERSHLGRGPGSLSRRDGTRAAAAAAATASAFAGGKTLDRTSSKHQQPLWRSASDTRFEFCRQRS